MRSVSSIVKQIMLRDEVVVEAAKRGVLNASSYARELTPIIEKATWTTVEPQTVAVAVKRLIPKLETEPIKPKVDLEKLTVETNIVDVTVERTTQVREYIASHIPDVRKQFPKDLFIETTGQSQTTMIFTERIWEVLKPTLSLFPPLQVIEKQCAISISFDEKYLEVPNFIYAILGKLALQRINVTEIFSTMTELVVVIHEKELETALRELRRK